VSRLAWWCASSRDGRGRCIMTTRDSEAIYVAESPRRLFSNRVFLQRNRHSRRFPENHWNPAPQSVFARRPLDKMSRVGKADCASLEIHSEIQSARTVLQGQCS